jgi:oligosaccharide repeat unit polymerase
MKAKLITNPYIVYSVAFMLVMLLYPLHWSLLYPDLSFSLICFLSITIVFYLIVGLVFHKANYFSYRDISFSDKNIWIWTAVILISYVIEFAYMHVVPIIAISTGADYEYTSFGVPTFHVVVVTFNSFWAVFIFHNYTSTKRRALLVPYILCLIPSILIFNRGMFLLIIASTLFVVLMSAKKLGKLLFKISVLLLIILFLFGILGNIRVTGGFSANDAILGLGHASKQFSKAPVPNEFFWAYLYTTSSLANLQETVNVHHNLGFSMGKVALFINSEIFPDFISKRNANLFRHIEPIDQISETFTVGTVYARSYAYFGWWGMAVMFLYIITFNMVVIFTLVKQSIFFVTGIAILNCIMLFNIFDNMFTFSGLVLQLTYPILFSAFSKVRFRRLDAGTSYDSAT